MILVRRFEFRPYVLGHSGVQDPSPISAVSLPRQAVLEVSVSPVPGCYEGVIVIDGNSLYGSLMKYLQIFVDRCTSASTIESLKVKTSVQLPQNADDMEVGRKKRQTKVWNTSSNNPSISISTVKCSERSWLSLLLRNSVEPDRSTP